MLGRSFVEGGKYFFRTLWISSIAITVLIMSIGLITLAFSTRQTLDVIVRQFDKKTTVQVLINDSSTELDIKNTEKAIREIPGVENVIFSSKEEEKKRLSDTSKTVADYNSIFDEIGFNPFQNAFIVTPASAESYKSVVEAISNINFTKANNILKVNAKQDLVDRLLFWYYWINIIGWASVLLLGFISILMIVNIIRISISYFQQEIEIQRLVGATNKYIRGPFIVQGFLFAAIASLIVGLIQGVLIYYAAPAIASYIDVPNIWSVRMDLLVPVAIILAGSLLVTTLAAWYATTRYLRK